MSRPQYVAVAFSIWSYAFADLHRISYSIDLEADIHGRQEGNVIDSFYQCVCLF